MKSQIIQRDSTSFRTDTQRSGEATLVSNKAGQLSRSPPRKTEFAPRESLQRVRRGKAAEFDSAMRRFEILSPFAELAVFPAPWRVAMAEVSADKSNGWTPRCCLVALSRPTACHLGSARRDGPLSSRTGGEPLEIQRPQTVSKAVSLNSRLTEARRLVRKRSSKVSSIRATNS